MWYQVMFDKQSNPYTRDVPDSDPEMNRKPPAFYIGTTEQNAKLARNILANKRLFKGGKLSPTVAKRWKLVK